MRLGSPDDIGECVLPLVLKRFAETHPGVTVDVVIDQSSNLRKRLDEREARCHAGQYFPGCANQG